MAVIFQIFFLFRSLLLLVVYLISDFVQPFKEANLDRFLFMFYTLFRYNLMKVSSSAQSATTETKASRQASPSANLGESNLTLIFIGACAGKLSMCLSLFVRFFRYLSELLTKVFRAESSDAGKNCNPFGSVVREHDHICPRDCHGECSNCWYM